MKKRTYLAGFILSAAILALPACADKTQTTAGLAESSFRESASASETIAEITESPISERESYYQFIQNNLIPEYKLAVLEEINGTMKKEEDNWFYPGGIVSAYIDDLDMDGSQELLLLSFKEAESGKEHTAKYQLFAEIYTMNESTPMKTSETPIHIFNDFDGSQEIFDVTFSGNHSGDKAVSISCIPADGRKYIVIEYSDSSYLFTADSYHGWEVLIYEAGKLNTAFSLTQSDSDMFSPTYYGYKVNEGTIVSKELVYSEPSNLWGDNDKIEEALKEFWSEAGIPLFDDRTVGSEILSYGVSPTGTNSDESGTTFSFLLEATDYTELRSHIKEEYQKAHTFPQPSAPVDNTAGEFTYSETGKLGRNKALSYIKGFEMIRDDALLAVKNYNGNPIGDELSQIGNLKQLNFNSENSYILLVPCYEGSEIRLESVNLESDGMLVPYDISREIELSPDNYALLVNIYLAEKVPHVQAIVTYNGRETTYSFTDANLAGFPYPLVNYFPYTHYVEYDPYHEPISSTVSIYSPDDDFMDYMVEQIELPGLTPEALINTLIEKDMLPDGTQVQSFSTHEADGKKLIDLDLSAEFYERLMIQGTTGEYLLIGSICNTFLVTYKADLIKITVDGSGYDTGHNDYHDYMGYHTAS